MLYSSAVECHPHVERRSRVAGGVRANVAWGCVVWGWCPQFLWVGFGHCAFRCGQTRVETSVGSVACVQELKELCLLFPEKEKSQMSGT